MASTMPAQKHFEELPAIYASPTQSSDYTFQQLHPYQNQVSYEPVMPSRGMFWVRDGVTIFVIGIVCLSFLLTLAATFAAAHG